MLDISKYYAFILPIIIWIFIFGVKIIIFSLKHGWNQDIKDTLAHVGHGHMPSAHTAFVLSLVTSIGYYKGMDSGAFSVAIILAIIIIDDSIRLRMYIGDQGMYLNRLAEHLNLGKEEFPKMKERTGHKISEVIVGGMLGIFLTIFLAKILEKYPLNLPDIFQFF
ncbi:MAG TPA: divergent PAP2 family protein [Candidatus Moranbacteria bacterium]|nr:divergent PAP2 family protein [Candidatus Moranbacteria bacterium]